ncbi:MAG: hypothetical protein ONA90_08580 [candidate division KSB1 bacterium]|nr:hypothetical protein [candidate division KSB1 bacterium]
MATDRYGKGSILYKILIVLLTAALVVSIIYPKTLWEREAKNQELCRNRMSNLYNAELQYQSTNARFSGEATELLSFIKADSRYAKRLDSLVVQPIKVAIQKLDSVRQIQMRADTLIASLISKGSSTNRLDSAVVDSIDRLEDQVIWDSRAVRRLLEAVRERMLTFPNLPISTLDRGLEIIERKEYFFAMEIVKRMVSEVFDLQQARVSSKDALANIASITRHLNATLEDIAQVPMTLDSLYFCPTFHDSIKIALVDSGVFRFANIYCPIDSADIRLAEKDFIKARIGALKIANHGRIEKNEKSWEQK